MKNIAVELSDLGELFQDPNFDPFDPESRCESGIADLFNQTQNLSPQVELQITISLPGHSTDLERQDEVRNAIQRYRMRSGMLSSATVG